MIGKPWVLLTSVSTQFIFGGRGAGGAYALARLWAMLTVLSPAKSLDFDSPLPTKKHSIPRLQNQAIELIANLTDKSPSELSALMKISDSLAELNVERYADFEDEPTVNNSRPAIFTFNGDVYQGLEASSFTARDLTEAQKTLRILSGLYGVLRPLDLIQPHRLEMGTRLTTERGRTLYDWWGNQVTDLLAEDLGASPGADVLVNLASVEYSTVINADRLGVRVISPRFEDEDARGNSKIISVFAKRARGSMARWIVKNRLRSPRGLADFAEDGYEYNPARSTSDRPVFIRPFERRP